MQVPQALPLPLSNDSEPLQSDKSVGGSQNLQEITDQIVAERAASAQVPQEGAQNVSVLPHESAHES